jgi:hypothetical protein
MIVGKWKLPTGRNYRRKSWGFQAGIKLRDGRDGGLKYLSTTVGMAEEIT